MNYVDTSWDFPKKRFKTRFSGAVQQYNTEKGVTAVLFTPDFACVVGEVGDTYTLEELVSKGGVLSYSFGEIADFENTYVLAEVVRDEGTTSTLGVQLIKSMLTRYGFDDKASDDIKERLLSVSKFGEYNVTSSFGG